MLASFERAELGRVGVGLGGDERGRVFWHVLGIWMSMRRARGEEWGWAVGTVWSYKCATCTISE